ncbi:MAG: hypothetical protein IKH93_06600 [Bacteroidales bacterium]|nr:hypothetical protein [Bacteroidales bacterium]
MSPTLFDHDSQVSLPASFLRGKTVLFVGNRDSAVHSYIEKDREELADRFEDVGYRLLFIPELAYSLEQSLLNYMFPGVQGELSVEGIYQHIQDIAKLKGQSGFLYKKDGKAHFRVVAEENIEASVDAFIDFLCEPYTGVLESAVPESEIRFSRQSAGMHCEKKARESFKQLHLPEVSVETPLDERARKIIAAWEEIERKYGISIEDLEIMLGYRVKLSHLNITTAGKIILTDWEGRPEVKMDDLTKAVYFYYLRHPEGCSLKELQDHEQEILHHYMSITGRDNVQEIHRSVHNLLDPYGNSLNVCISRIKKAFRDVVGDRVAKFYYVDGRYAKKRKIAIDRDLVIWSH